MEEHLFQQTKIKIDSIGLFEYNGNEVIEEVEIAEGVDEIPASAFRGCTALKKVKLPSAIKEIADKAFYGCTSLSKIDFPASLETIKGQTFVGTALKKIVLPESLQWMIDGPFEWGKLKSVESRSPYFVVENDCLYDDSHSCLYGCWGDALPEDEDITIQTGAFRSNRKLKAIETMAKIEVNNCAFMDSTALRSVSYRSNEVLPEAFKGCRSLKTVNIYGCNDIYGEAFAGCEKLSTINLDSIQVIRSGAFAKCPALKKIKLLPTIEDIDEDAFDVGTLEEIIIPKGTTSYFINVLPEWMCSILKEK